MVRLPLLGFLNLPSEVRVRENLWEPGANPHAPPLPYRPPQNLVVYKWPAPSIPAQDYAPDTKRLLGTFLEFARFPLVIQREERQDSLFLKMLDLRFTVPGRAFPYVLELAVTQDGRLADWRLGRMNLWRK